MELTALIVLRAEIISLFKRMNPEFEEKQLGILEHTEIYYQCGTNISVWYMNRNIRPLPGQNVLMTNTLACDKLP